MNTYTPWREQLGQGLGNLQEALRPRFEDTKHVRVYSSWLVPGMLQTRGYIEAIFASIQEERALTDEDVQMAVESRLERQPLIFSPEREYEFLIEESSLCNGVGGFDVMKEQLLYLASLLSADEPSIGVIPTGVNRKRWPEASFWMFDNNRVSIELVSGGVDLRHPVDVAEYAARFSQLAAEAVYGTNARNLVLGILETITGVR